MTATNIIVHSSGVSLITDGAFYDEQGIVREIASKVAIAPPRFRMALAVSGRAFARRVADRLVGAADQTEAIARLPGVIDAMHAENLGHKAGATASDFSDLQVFIAIWSDVTDRAEAWAISSGRSFFGPEYTPGTLVEIEQIWAPDIQRGGFDPERFDPEPDAIAVLIEQRQRLHEIGGHFAVGGFGELTTVRRDGVTKHRICEWPDSIGEPIAA